MLGPPGPKSPPARVRPRQSRYRRLSEIDLCACVGQESHLSVAPNATSPAMMMATTATSESDIYFVRDYVFLGWYRTNKPGPLRLINARPSVAPFGDEIAGRRKDTEGAASIPFNARVAGGRRRAHHAPSGGGATSPQAP